MLKNVDIKFNRFTYISAKNDVVIGENVEKCWCFNFYLKMLKFSKSLILKFNHFTYISAINVVVIGENVEKCWFLNFYLKCWYKNLMFYIN